MVLQRAPLQAPLFGQAEPRATLIVTLALATAVKAVVFNTSVEADGAGQWSCLLPAQPASGAGVSHVVTVAAVAAGGAAPSAVLSGVLFGDVFVCSGQSNMEEPLSVVNNATAEFAASSAFPWVRLAVVRSGSSDAPLRDTATALELPWQRASPAALGSGNKESWAYFRYSSP
jgi:sialate O-acetylesterase